MPDSCGIGYKTRGFREKHDGPQKEKPRGTGTKRAENVEDMSIP